MLEMERKDSNDNYMRDIYTIQQTFQLKELVIDREYKVILLSHSKKAQSTCRWVD